MKAEAKDFLRVSMGEVTSGEEKLMTWKGEGFGKARPYILVVQGGATSMPTQRQLFASAT